MTTVYIVCFALTVAVVEAIQGPSTVKNVQLATTTQKTKTTVISLAVNKTEHNHTIKYNLTTANDTVKIKTNFESANDIVTTPSSNKAVSTQKSKTAIPSSLVVNNTADSNAFNYNVTIENGTDVVKPIEIESPIFHSNESSTNHSSYGLPFVVIKTNIELSNNTVTTPSNNKETTGTSMVTSANTTTAITTTVSTTIIDATKNNAVPLKILTDKYCSCDLTFGSCDLNCCCDSECSISDLKTFTLCSTEVIWGIIKLKSILFDSSLFYVIVDNVPSNYFYPEREPIETETQVQSVLRNRNVIELHVDNTLTNHLNHRLNLVYKSLHWIFVYSNRNTNESTAFSLKNSAFDSLCSVDDLVEYLVDKDTSCDVYIQNLTESCKNNSILSFNRFCVDRGFKVSHPIYDYSSKTEKIELVNLKAVVHHCFLVMNGSYNCSIEQINPPTPVFSINGSTCRNVVEIVEYVFQHNGTRGVKNLDVYFFYRDVSNEGQKTPMYFKQQFKVKFKWANQNINSYPLSGKPGYLQGKPVIIKHKQSKPNEVQFLSVPTSESRACDSNSKLLVDFNYNVKTTCVFRWKKKESITSIDFCQQLQAKIILMLGSYDDLMVSSMGDPNVSKWIPIMVLKPTISDQCKNVVNRISMKVFFSNVGSFENPQATIHGILVNFSSIHYNGYEIDNEKTTFEIPIINSVKFVDLTKAPIREFADPPTYEFRLPEDFFYPFLSGGYRTYSKFSIILLLSVLNLLL